MRKMLDFLGFAPQAQVILDRPRSFRTSWNSLM